MSSPLIFISRHPTSSLYSILISAGISIAPNTSLRNFSALCFIEAISSSVFITGSCFSSTNVFFSSYTTEESKSSLFLLFFLRLSRLLFLCFLSLLSDEFSFSTVSFLSSAASALTSCATASTLAFSLLSFFSCLSAESSFF